MTINRLTLNHFRNYAQLDVTPAPGVNLICGENAQGKTNFLEAIFFLSCVKSFHAKKERELIQFGEVRAQIEADVTTRERTLALRLELYENAKRKIFENQILQKRLLDYVGTVQTVVFSPDDLLMIKEGPSNRRRFLNIAISQLKPNYIQTLAEYNRIIEHKNKILKNDDTPAKTDLLAVFNEKLARAGAVLIRYRSDFINNLSNYAKTIHHEMSGRDEILTLRYATDRYIENPNGETESLYKSLLSHLEDRTAAEMEAHACLIGPHKDDLEILVDGMPAKFFASQGQIRTAVLSLKMAERAVFEQMTGELPILLLDDVLSELDKNRQAYLLHKISHGQVFISSCSNHIFEKSEDVCTFVIKNGAVIINKS